MKIEKLRVADAATGFLVILALLVVGWTAWSQNNTRQVPATGPREDRVIKDWDALLVGGNWRGTDNAEVRIVVFGDYRCPFCKRLEGSLDWVLSRFPEDVAVVHRHLPLLLRSGSYEAARMAECGAAQGRFLDTHRFLFDMPSSRSMEPEALGGVVQAPDLKEFTSCARSNAPVARIEADIAAAKERGISAVPAVIVEGTLQGTPPDSSAFLRLVEQAIGERAAGRVAKQGTGL